MKYKIFVAACVLLFFASCNRNKTWDTVRTNFLTTPISVRPNPLWFWNNTPVEHEELKAQMLSFKESGYGGLSILPFGRNFKPEYLTPEYFAAYRTCVEEAEKLGMTLWVYDEYGFPSGSAGLVNGDDISRFGLKYPDHIIKRLDKIEYILPNNTETYISVPPGILMATVAMDTITLQRIDLSSFIIDNILKWKVPEGGWKLMFFLCRNDEAILDYLDPEAADFFVELTHEQYLKHFGEYFGSTIVGTFFDEPTLYRAQGRSWTAKFNQKFEAKHGFSPALYYPALWYDIGEETQEARNYMFGFRSDLYAEGYTKVVGDWSKKHGLLATGHQDNEEVVNPVGTSADLMKCFKYLEIPGIDKIGGNRPAENFYKVVSSAAHNWDNSIVMSETYGDMGNISWDMIYRIAMDQYVKGINLLIPHAVWYNTARVTFRPELSSRNPIYAQDLPAFNTYLSRLNAVMQNDARWVGDIAMLYPIETMQAQHYMDGPLGHYRGGVEIPEIDYVDVGIALFDNLGYDYMFLHPEVLEEKCDIIGELLKLNNKVQYNDFSVLVIPSSKIISLSVLQKAQDFANAGGKVIFTTNLPEQGTKVKDNQAVKKIIEEMFLKSEETSFGKKSQTKNGIVLFVADPKPENLETALKNAQVNWNLQFKNEQRVKNIHKVYSGKNLWFLANNSRNSKSLEIAINGKYNLSVWDPHTGAISKLENANYVDNKTEIKLEMNALHSLFLIEE